MRSDIKQQHQMHQRKSSLRIYSKKERIDHNHGSLNYCPHTDTHSEMYLIIYIDSAKKEYWWKLTCKNFDLINLTRWIRPHSNNNIPNENGFVSEMLCAWRRFTNSLRQAMSWCCWRESMSTFYLKALWRSWFACFHRDYLKDFRSWEKKNTKDWC